MTTDDYTCPICLHRFDTVEQRDAHVPCSETGDERGDTRAPGEDSQDAFIYGNGVEGGALRN